MAANLDKSENSLTSVSTLTYLRGIDASGNSVKISTSDLASVLGVTSKQGGLNSAFYWNVGDGEPFIGTNQTVIHLSNKTQPENFTKIAHRVENYNNVPTPELKIQSGYHDQVSEWHNVALDIPDFYKSYANLDSLANALGGIIRYERNVFMKKTASEDPVSHTVPGIPILLFWGIEVSHADDLTADKVNKIDLIPPTFGAFANYWCRLNGNTITFNFTGYQGAKYGAIKFDVLYIPE